jgi:hypothetical protein
MSWSTWEFLSVHCRGKIAGGLGGHARDYKKPVKRAYAADHTGRLFSIPSSINACIRRNSNADLIFSLVMDPKKMCRCCNYVSPRENSISSGQSVLWYRRCGKFTRQPQRSNTGEATLVITWEFLSNMNLSVSSPSFTL